MEDRAATIHGEFCALFLPGLRFLLIISVLRHNTDVNTCTYVNLSTLTAATVSFVLLANTKLQVVRT